MRLQLPQPPAEPVSIIIGVTDQIASLDPADAYSTHDWELIRNTGRTLLRWNPGTSDLVPDMATGMPDHFGRWPDLHLHHEDPVSSLVMAWN